MKRTLSYDKWTQAQHDRLVEFVERVRAKLIAGDRMAWEYRSGICWAVTQAFDVSDYAWYRVVRGEIERFAPAFGGRVYAVGYWWPGFGATPPRLRCLDAIIAFHTEAAEKCDE